MINMKGDTVQRMRILNYKIQSAINVKAEITKLVGFPIKNETDSFYLVIPTLISTLPDNVMFIQETLLIEPHSTKDYIPKVVKLGVTLSQSSATKLPKGIEIKLIVIDDIKNEISNISSTINIRSKNTKSNTNNLDKNDVTTISMANTKNNTYLSGGEIYKTDRQQIGLLATIDNVIMKNEQNTVDEINNRFNKEEEYDDVTDDQEVVVTEELPSQVINHNIYNDSVTDSSQDQSLLPQPSVNQIVKRGRGRPRKNPVIEPEASKMLETLAEEENNDIN